MTSNEDSKEEEYPVTSDQYTIDLFIGSGAFAQVYSAICKPLNKRVAIKVIELESGDPSEDGGDQAAHILDIQREAAIMRSMRHENVVTCFASFVFQRELWLVMPLLEGGSCADIMQVCKQFKNGFKEETQLATILKDVLNGIEYCHKDSRIHRDIKARNILLGTDGVAKLADFGVSGTLVEGGLRRRGRNTLTGTPCWMAPEVMNKDKYNHKADIWSFGITALELAFGHAPNSDKQPFKVMMNIMENPPPTVDSMGVNKFSRAFKTFVSKCLIKEKDKRSSATQLLKDSWLKQSKDKQYIIETIIVHSKPLITNSFKPGQPKSVSGVSVTNVFNTNTQPNNIKITTTQPNNNNNNKTNENTNENTNNIVSPKDDSIFDNNDDNEFRFSQSLHLDENETGDVQNIGRFQVEEG